jgi:hypothetical protein
MKVRPLSVINDTKDWTTYQAYWGLADKCNTILVVTFSIPKRVSDTPYCTLYANNMDDHESSIRFIVK